MLKRKCTQKCCFRDEEVRNDFTDIVPYAISQPIKKYFQCTRHCQMEPKVHFGLRASSRVALILTLKA